MTGYEPDQPLLEPEEVAFVLAMRERLRKVDHLYQESEAERVQWEATHPDDEPYIALDHKGAAAYSECVEALADTAVDAFNLVSRALGVSGWQASVAEMQFFARSRRIKGPWGVYLMEDALYPQYDLHERLQQMRWSDETVKWLGDCAEYALAAKDIDGGLVHPNVVDHWRWLVAQRDERAKVPADV